MDVNKKWLQGKNVTRSEFKDLLLNHEDFLLKMMPKENKQEFKKLTKAVQIRQIMREKFKKDRWIWAWCVSLSAAVFLKKAYARKDIYDSLEWKLYPIDCLSKERKISTDKYELATGESRKKFHVTKYRVPIPC